MKDIEVISNITKIRVKVFTHNDLDGVSCALVLKKLYNSENISFNFDFITYSDFDKIKNFFDIDNEDGAKFYDYLFITDINIKEDDFFTKIYNPFKKFNTLINDPDKSRSSLFKKIFIIDHHKDSENTLRNRFESLRPKIEYYNDMTYCGSLQLYNFIINNQSLEWTTLTLGFEHPEYKDRKEWLKSYLKHVNDWDTFEWKNNGNIIARDLNMVFTHINRSKFFLMQEQKNGLSFYFNKTEKNMIKELLEQIKKDYTKLLNTSIVLDHIDEEGFPHPDIQYIIIRSDENTSLLCDMLRDDIINKKIYLRYNIKYIVNISFKYGNISFRRIFNDIDLVSIANMYGGGGHPYASGATMDGKNILQLERIIMPSIEAYGREIY